MKGSAESSSPDLELDRDLRLLVGVQRGGSVDHEASRFERMLRDIDLHPLGEKITTKRPGIRGRVDLLAIRQRIACQRVVALPARELAYPANGSVDNSEARPNPEGRRRGHRRS